MDPADFLVYTALVYEIGHELEERRITESDNVVHSYRFQAQKNGAMYNHQYGYHSFLQECGDLVDRDYDWVVLADVADFFPRLYHHRLKNALSVATLKQNHVIAIDRLISGWSESYSYGIPVGPTASRLLAEVALDDVDKSIVSEGATYVRFSDDFRIFCRTKREAYERLSFLANVLFENHGLTLQQHKTRILPVDAFNARHLASEREAEVNSLTRSFEAIVFDLGLEHFSEAITWQSLTEEQKVEVTNLNLAGLLDEQIGQEEIDISLTRFVLKRLAQLSNSEALDGVLGNLDKLYPVFSDVVRYIHSLREMSQQEKAQTGSRLIAALKESVVSHLEFHRMWLLTLFSADPDYNNQEQFVSICSQWPDHITQREAILALGRSRKDTWFRTRKRSVFDFSSWERRALLYGGSCLPSDERKHWYQSLESRLDPVERVTAKWARQNPM